MLTKEMIERRNKAHEEAKSILDKAEGEKRALTAEEKETVRKLDGEVRELGQKLEQAAQDAEDERALRDSVRQNGETLAASRGLKTQPAVRGQEGEVNPLDGEMAFRGWCLGRHATPAMREAAARLGVDIHQPNLDMGVRTRHGADGKPARTFMEVRTSPAGDIVGPVERRALSVGTTDAGGYSVPNEMMRAFYEVQLWYGRVREQAQVIQTETGATLPWPTVDDTGNTGAILAEATAAATNADPTFGVVNLGAFKFSSKAILVSWELLQDSFIDIAAYLGTALGRRIGRIQNNKFTVGVGTTEPKGFVAGAAVGKTAAATNAFTLDEVIDLIHSVDIAYRNLPGTGFNMHDTIAAVARKFKDSEGHYLWEMSTQLGQPDRLFGYPVSINNDMDSALTTGKKLLAFGNLGLAYVLRDAGAVRFVRADELYVLQHQVMFEASQRSDGNVIDSTAIKVLALA